MQSHVFFGFRSPALSASGEDIQVTTPPSSLAVGHTRLENSACALIKLLKTVDICGSNLYCGPALMRAVWRYETLWLPLLGALSIVESGFYNPSDYREASSSGNFQRMRNISARLNVLSDVSSYEVAPPLDVAWVWYIHRLSVNAYLADVIKLIGVPVVPDASSAFCFGMSNSSQRADLWHTIYCNTSHVVEETDELDFCSYFPQYLKPMVNRDGRVLRRKVALGSIVPPLYESELSYDIARGIEIHRGSLWLFIRNSSLNEDYLREAILRYESYMYFRGLHPGRQFTPPPDVRFVWRVHAACTADYVNDMLLFRALHPNDAGDKNSLSYLSHPDAHALYQKNEERIALDPVGDAETEELWNNTFKSTRGSYISERHAPFLKPSGVRDVYLRNILDMQRANHGTSADTSDSSSEDWDSEDSELDDVLSPFVPERDEDIENTKAVRKFKDLYVVTPGSDVSQSGERLPSIHFHGLAPGGGKDVDATSDFDVDSLAVISFASGGVVGDPREKHGQRHKRNGRDVHSPQRHVAGSPGRGAGTSIREQRLRRQEEAEIRRHRLATGTHGVQSWRPGNFSRVQIALAAMIGVVGAAVGGVGVWLISWKEAALHKLGSWIVICGLVCLALALTPLQSSPGKHAKDQPPNAPHPQRRRRGLRETTGTAGRVGVSGPDMHRDLAAFEETLSVGERSELTSFTTKEVSV